MKNNLILIPILLCCIVIAATSPQQSNVVPATPKKTVTLALRSMMGIENEIKSKIDVLHLKGILLRLLQYQRTKIQLKLLLY
jgi:hypothetical protein